MVFDWLFVLGKWRDEDVASLPFCIRMLCRSSNSHCRYQDTTICGNWFRSDSSDSIHFVAIVSLDNLMVVWTSIHFSLLGSSYCSLSVSFYFGFHSAPLYLFFFLSLSFLVALQVQVVKRNNYHIYQCSLFFSLSKGGDK